MDSAKRRFKQKNAVSKIQKIYCVCLHSIVTCGQKQPVNYESFKIASIGDRIQSYRANYWDKTAVNDASAEKKNEFID